MKDVNVDVTRGSLESIRDCSWPVFGSRVIRLMGDLARKGRGRERVYAERGNRQKWGPKEVHEMPELIQDLPEHTMIGSRSGQLF